MYRVTDIVVEHYYVLYKANMFGTNVCIESVFCKLIITMYYTKPICLVQTFVLNLCFVLALFV